MYGLPKGLLYGQNERVDELNTRIQSRQFPDSPLEPNITSRPAMSKYSHFPMTDGKARNNTNIPKYSSYSIESNFSPATSRGPPKTFLDNVDIESGLRNQNTSFQRNAIQSVYVPSSESDLYKIKLTNTKNIPIPHPNLFSTPSFNTFRENSLKNTSIGKDTFNNHTRTQLRGM